MSLGRFEQHTYDNHEQPTETTKNLAIKEITTETSNALSGLKNSIMQSSSYLDETEKKSIIESINKEERKNIIQNTEKREGLFNSIDNDLGDLVAQIREEIHDGDNSLSVEKAFDKTWGILGAKNFKEYKERRHTKREDQLVVAGMTRFFNDGRDGSPFKSIDGSPEKEFIKQYNHGDQIAQLRFDKINSQDTDFANHSPHNQSQNNESKVADVDFRKNSPYTSGSDNYNVGGFWNPNSGQPKNRPGEVA